MAAISRSLRSLRAHSTSVSAISSLLPLTCTSSCIVRPITIAAITGVTPTPTRRTMSSETAVTAGTSRPNLDNLTIEQQIKAEARKVVFLSESRWTITIIVFLLALSFAMANNK
jgi:hypothetical protein